jgi:hypothetical protein
MSKAVYYATSDLPLAATIALFYPMSDIDRTDPRRARFLFEDNDVVQSVVERYNSGVISVNPKDYFYELKGIKTKLYSNRM